MNRRDFEHMLSNGKKIKIQYETIYGVWDDTTNTVSIDPAQTEQEELDTLIHEVLHAEVPNWDEQQIGCIADSISQLLWKAGYRKKRK